jgi:uncharacterized protein with FMN-binding domain
MSTSYQPRTSKFMRMVRKLSVSTFVLFTFIAYAIHERLAGSQGVNSAGVPAIGLQAQQAQPAPTTLPAAPSATQGAVAIAPTAAQAPPTQALPTQAPPTQALPTQAPPTQAPLLGLYRDGDYTGTEVDAYYGLVQVQATIKQGKLADVQFLEYPNDRRTSIRINNIAMPYLQQEAIQAQSARVDLISGATLTSQAFVQSLEMALNSAKAKA